DDLSLDQLDARILRKDSDLSHPVILLDRDPVTSDPVCHGADWTDNNMRVPLARCTVRSFARTTELPAPGVVLGSRLMSSSPNTPRLDAYRAPLLLSPPTAPGEGLRTSCWACGRPSTSASSVLLDALIMSPTPELPPPKPPPKLPPENAPPLLSEPSGAASAKKVACKAISRPSFS